MKILLTGASGFIGCRILKSICASYGAENIIVLSSMVSGCCSTILYDDFFQIIDPDQDQLDSIEIIIHAGAYTPKSSTDADHLDGCNSNVKFTAQLLQHSFNKLRKIIYISTIDVYGLPSETISEDTLTLPQSLYGFSKLYCEKMVTAYADQNQIESLILRVGHVYGPGEEAYSKFLPTAIRRIVDNEGVELWGDGSELRTFIFIDDVVNAIERSLELEFDFDVINLVGSIPMSIRQVLDVLITISGKKVQVVSRDNNRVSRDLVFDNSRYALVFGGDSVDLEAGLRMEYEHVDRLA